MNNINLFEQLMASGNTDAAQSIVSSNPLDFSSYDFSKIDAGALGTDPSGEGLLGGLNNMLGTNMSGMDALKGGLGIGQLGLGVMSFLDQKKTAKKQRGLMDQQMKQNKFLLNTAKDRQTEIGQQFGGGGLAASAQ